MRKIYFSKLKICIILILYNTSVEAVDDSSISNNNNTDIDNGAIITNNKQPRIIKGSSIFNAEMFPSYASIRRSGKEHFAGGVILDEYRILTAAHSLVTKKDTIYVGGTKRDGSDKQQELKVRRFFQHPKFNSSLTNDISVIELESAITFTSKVKPVELGTEEEFENFKNGSAICQLVGHGYIARPDSVGKVLQVGNQTYTKKRSCRYYGIKSKNCFLARDENGSQACHGDSGGPLYCNVGDAKKLFGIVSFVGSETCSEGYTGFSLPIRYEPFIKSIIERVDAQPRNESASAKFSRALLSFMLIFIVIFII